MTRILRCGHIDRCSENFFHQNPVIWIGIWHKCEKCSHTHFAAGLSWSCKFMIETCLMHCYTIDNRQWSFFGPLNIAKILLMWPYLYWLFIGWQCNVDYGRDASGLPHQTAIVVTPLWTTCSCHDPGHRPSIRTGTLIIWGDVYPPSAEILLIPNKRNTFIWQINKMVIFPL